MVPFDHRKHVDDKVTMSFPVSFYSNINFPFSQPRLVLFNPPISKGRWLLPPRWVPLFSPKWGQLLVQINCNL